MDDTTTTQSDINRILSILVTKWKFILLFVIGALAIGAFARWVLPPTYKATTKFIVRSPMLYDRNQIFRQEWYQNKATFGDEDDVDMILAYFHGDFYRIGLVDGLGLQKSFGDKAYPLLEKNIKLKRNDTRELELFYYDKDKNRAAQVAEMTRDLLEKKHSEYFQSYNQNIKEVLQAQLDLTNRHLSKIDDSIASYRDAHGLHEYLTPARNKNDATTQRAGNSQNIHQLEHLKNLVTEKDKIAEDKARITSLVNEHSMTDGDKLLRTFFVIQHATPGATSVYPNAILYYGTIFLVAFVLAYLIALVTASRAKA